MAFSNFPWTSSYRTTGPVVVHAEPCVGASGDYPHQFERKAQIVRAYGDDAGRAHTLVYDLNIHVPAGKGLHDEITRILNDSRVEFVQASNVLAGCYSFTARLDRPDSAGRPGHPAAAIAALTPATPDTQTPVAS
ncbi:DUF1203 domain-containing protein [Austwickia sp. TVS 96-490-7B]|uniref:DUF1203 domain-containing protein n=1 Tax=Austwickia sp. TVS 96-490-7B TaxID=2830843 RepID=UPI0021054D36|nr:DUF1203 domain-containing protein [Austwickia sp. TVS 96-490-7B]